MTPRSSGRDGLAGRVLTGVVRLGPIGAATNAARMLEDRTREDWLVRGLEKRVERRLLAARRGPVAAGRPPSAAAGPRR